MKNQNTMISASGLEGLQARFALRLAARLNEGARELPADVTERLRFAREQALERARLVHKAEAAGAVQTVGRGGSASLAFGGAGSQRWFKLASVLPVIALIGGFLLIEHVHQKSQIAAAAEIDAALLADDVPPSAYSDPGFVEFLKAPRD